MALLVATAAVVSEGHKEGAWYEYNIVNIIV